MDDSDVRSVGSVDHTNMGECPNGHYSNENLDL